MPWLVAAARTAASSVVFPIPTWPLDDGEAAAACPDAIEDPLDPRKLLLRSRRGNVVLALVSMPGEPIARVRRIMRHAPGRRAEPAPLGMPVATA